MVRSENDNYRTPVSTSKVHLLFRVFQHKILVFFKDEIIIFVIALSNNNQLNDTHGYNIKSTNSTCSMISCFRRKGPCSSKKCVSAVKFYLLSKSVIDEKYFEKKTTKMYAKICVALGVCFSIFRLYVNL